MTNDYVARSKNRARYLPAGQHSTHVMPYRTAVPQSRPQGLPSCLNSLVDLDFLDAGNPLFTYDRALYSAGQHIGGSGVLTKGTFSRRPGVTILTDSGGLQYARGAAWQGDASRVWALRFAEAHGDEAIGLDIPTAAIALNHPTFATFQACLDTTLENNRYWLQHRRANTRFLAVIQGRNLPEVRDWTTAAMTVPMEGWSIGGGMRSNYLCVAETLLRLRTAGLLGRDRNRIHVLGNSSLTQAVMLSALQHSLRELQQDPELLITFDTATPWEMSALGQAYRYATLTKDKFSMVPCNPPSDHVHVNNATPWPRSSAIGERMTIGSPIVASAQRQNGWDTLGNELVINHNIESLLRGIDDANSAMELPPGYQGPFAPPAVIGAYNALRTMHQYPRDPLGHLARYRADLNAVSR